MDATFEAKVLTKREEAEQLIARHTVAGVVDWWGVHLDEERCGSFLLALAILDIQLDAQNWRGK